MLYNELKKYILFKQNRGDELSKSIESNKSKLKNKSGELKNQNELGSIILDKMQLLDNINTLSEEVDNLSAKNNILLDIVKCRDNPKELSKIKKEIFSFQSENNLLKEKLSSQFKEKIFLNASNREYRHDKLFSCFSKNEEDGYTVNLANSRK